MNAHVFSPYMIPVLIALIIDVFVGILILYKKPKARLNQLGAALLLIVGLWIFGVIMMATSISEYTAIFWARILWLGACFIPSFALHFGVVFTNTLPPRLRKYLCASHLIGVCFYFFVLEGVTYLPIGLWDVYKGGPVFKLYGIYLISAIAVTLYLLWRKYVATKNRVEKNQIKYMLIGMAIAGIGGPVFEVVLPATLIHVAPLGGIFVAVMGVFIGYAIIRYKLFNIEAVVETHRAALEAKRLEPGFSYLIKESGSPNSYEIFRGMVSNTPGLCISTIYPQKLRAEYKLEKTPIFWVTETTTTEQALNPYRLDFEILYTIESFIKGNERTLVLIDDPNYLSMVNGFEKTVEFIKTVNDIASANNGIIILPTNPESFDEKELVLVESIFDEVIDLTPLRGVHANKTEVKNTYSYLVKEDSPIQGYDMFKSSWQKGLCITKSHPSKITAKYNVQDTQIYWLTDTTSYVKSLNPERLEVEIYATISEFVSAGEGIVFIDGLDILILRNGFDKVHEFLKAIIDIISVSNASVIVSINPRLYKNNELALLEKRFDVLCGENA